MLLKSACLNLLFQLYFFPFELLLMLFDIEQQPCYVLLILNRHSLNLYVPLFFGYLNSIDDFRARGRTLAGMGAIFSTGNDGF